jgi:glycosyltransferase involved in cell wall biosynthesis
VVHTFDTVSSLPAILQWKRRLGLRVVVELHGLASAEMGGGVPLARPLAAWLERFVLRRADGIIAMSHSQREYLVNVVGVPAERIHVIWGPVDLDVFRFREAEETGALRVGYSGNDFRWQGVDDCLAAARQVANECDIEFLFVTGSGWRTEVTGLHRVRLAAAGTREQTAESLAGCHVLVSPRKGRAADLQYPFKLSSYLAVGRPIIATDVSDQRRIIEGANCGLMIPPGSPGDLAAAILRLRDEGAQGRREMGRRARRFAEEHLSLERFHEALFAVYRAIGV